MSGKLSVVGIGPGGLEHLTPAARAAIETATVVVGYRPYLAHISSLLAGKETLASGMRQEVERCRLALARAAAGASVALVSSGDAGIYGMAGLVLELVENDDAAAASRACPGAQEDAHGGVAPREVDVEIVPGISALQAAASRLGAPLMHDFVVVSLSDLLTPWPTILRRLEAAAAADFVTVLYNPRSHGRPDHLDEALAVLRCHLPAATPLGIVRNACRDGEAVTVATLADCPSSTVDMLSVVVIGNRSTFTDAAGRMVTPRGYKTRERETARSDRPSAQPAAGAAAARALFVGGTGSDVGKSVIAAGLCRILKRRGFAVAPFKAQNMALNSAVTPQGGEIGRAQALQAAACGLSPHPDMNPVLLKPNSATGSQVIVQGRPVGNMSVRQYHAYKDEAFARVRESFDRLAARHEVVVLEGAGSIAEINLREQDIVNLRAARMADAPVVLVADIDRGGVFAAIVGTIELLSPEERERIVGVVINKFRGDPSLLAAGIAAVTARTGVPVLGVVPWIDLHLPEEDSLALARKTKKRGGGVRIGVLRLPRLSNYTDFDPLEAMAAVDLVYLDRPEELAGLDLLIVPGSKSTLADLEYLRQRGWVAAIQKFHQDGGRIAGICGGFQMLGRRVRDPQGIESDLRESEGIGLLDVETVLRPDKQTHQGIGAFLPAAAAVGFAAGETVRGYEIHQGETTLGATARPLLRLSRRSGQPVARDDGAVAADGRVWGAYLHGLFDDASARRGLLAWLRPDAAIVDDGAPDLETELDRLADHLEAHLDLQPLFCHLRSPGREAI